MLFYGQIRDTLRFVRVHTNNVDNFLMYCYHIIAYNVHIIFMQELYFSIFLCVCFRSITNVIYLKFFSIWISFTG